jgi:SecD/SecF fusion protein
VVSVGNDNKTYEIVTPSADAVAVRKVILDSLGDRLKIDLPSSFADVSQPATEVLDRLIVPLHRDHLDDLKKATGGWIPGNWQSYRGGAAIVLKDIDPPLPPSQIRARIDRERLQPNAGQGEQRYRDIVVESPNGNDEPTKLAIVMISDPLLPFQEDPAKWRDELAVPMWKTIGDALNKPANLQKVSNFDAQVAGDTQRDAMMALVLSLMVIMVYIWLRFGNLKYGTATMMAMVHDTLLVIAAIGLSHLLAQFVPPIAHALLLEPFRMNITIVAAILTVMSYSMIDTIVVFDRVRENRGKYGHLDRRIINDSINQTMSRTLLTAGTNIMTLFFMYIFGGPGIHGFTFVLLFGILVGTYSSIAIAAPIMLISRHPAPQPQATGKKAAVAARLQRVGG